MRNLILLLFSVMIWACANTTEPQVIRPTISCAADTSFSPDWFNPITSKNDTLGWYQNRNILPHRTADTTNGVVRQMHKGHCYDLLDSLRYLVPAPNNTVEWVPLDANPGMDIS